MGHRNGANSMRPWDDVLVEVKIVLRRFHRFATTLFTAGIMAIPIAAVAQQPGYSGITFEGTARTGSDVRRVQFRFFCTSNKVSNITGAPSALGALSVEIEVPNFKQLGGVFNFDPFEGPEADAGSLALTHLQAGGVRTTMKGNFTVAGWIAGDAPTSFVLGVSATRRQQTAKFGALANLLRELVDGPSHFVWRQESATSGGGSIQASLNLSAADAARLRTALGTCLHPEASEASPQEATAPPNLPRPQTGAAAAAPSCDEIDLSSSEPVARQCQLEADGQVLRMTFAPITTGGASGDISVDVIGEDGAVVQTLQETEVHEYHAPSVQDVDSDGRGDVLIQRALGNVNAVIGVWIFNKERGRYDRAGEVSGVEIARTAEGYIAVPARASAVEWEISFYRLLDGQLALLATVNVEATGEKATSTCQLSEAPGLGDLDLTPRAAEAKFCAEPAAQVFGQAPEPAAMVSASIARADDCASAMDQRTMDECADKPYKKSDAELNVLYKQIEQRLEENTDTTKLLVAAQRAWLTFRDAECKFSTSGVSGGSVYPMIYAGCADGLTRKRVDAFKTYLKCEEGDLSCPVPAK